MIEALKEHISGDTEVAGTPLIAAPTSSHAAGVSATATKIRNLPLTRQTARRWTDNDVRDRQE